MYYWYRQLLDSWDRWLESLLNWSSAEFYPLCCPAISCPGCNLEWCFSPSSCHLASHHILKQPESLPARINVAATSSCLFLPAGLLHFALCCPQIKLAKLPPKLSQHLSKLPDFWERQKSCSKRVSIVLDIWQMIFCQRNMDLGQRFDIRAKVLVQLAPA